jgi:hypothetical protein
MQLNKLPNYQPPKTLTEKKPANEPPQNDEPKNDKPNSWGPVGDFWDRNETAVNLAGGALVGAILANVAGLPSEAIMSAAGSGALAGFFAGSKENALKMTAGCAIGATVGALAGLQGPAMVSAAGTGTLLAFLFARD